MLTIHDIFQEARARAIRHFDEYDEEPVIEVICVQAPTGNGYRHYYYDEEYSFKGTEPEYNEWVKEYFDYQEIEEQYVYYGDPGVDDGSHVNVSVLYVKDW